MHIQCFDFMIFSDLTLLYLLNVLINLLCLRLNNQILQKFEVYCMNIISEFTSTPNGELFCKFSDCLVKSDKRFMVEAHRRSAQH